MSFDLILKYFPDLNEAQITAFKKIQPFYEEWNQMINVISRKDIDKIYLHHVLHSLSIAKFMSFKENTTILDLGTGGGFPGIPLAIMFPESNFLLIDGTAKKIKVVNACIEELGIQNAKGMAKRSEEIKMKFDFVLARAVTRLEKLLPLSLRLVSDHHRNSLPNGLITLKGGELDEEIKEVSPYHHVEKLAVSSYFEEPYFQEKYILYIQG